jgi:hypothetical protein
MHAKKRSQFDITALGGPPNISVRHFVTNNFCLQISFIDCTRIVFLCAKESISKKQNGGLVDTCGPEAWAQHLRTLQGQQPSSYTPFKP